MSSSENRPGNKIDWQNTVIATVISGLLLIIVFLCPWRVESTGELRWSPIYQQPMSYVRSYDNQHGMHGSSRIAADEAEIAYDILALEVVIFTIVGGIAYIFSPDHSKRKINSKYSN